MRIFRARFTVRRLMVAVAIVGLVEWSIQECRRRSVRFQAMAYAHSDEVPFRCGFVAEAVVRRKLSPDEEISLRREVARENYHRQMSIKYARAARYPWLPVAPDPPEPE